MRFNQIKRFLGEIETENFTVWDYFFLLYFMNYRLKKSCPKGFNVVYLSEITTTTLTFRDRNADVTYCADVTLFLHATSD